jgi:hypothetical protein
VPVHSESKRLKSEDQWKSEESDRSDESRTDTSTLPVLVPVLVASTSVLVPTASTFTHFTVLLVFVTVTVTVTVASRVLTVLGVPSNCNSLWYQSYHWYACDIHIASSNSTSTSTGALVLASCTSSTVIGLAVRIPVPLVQ